MSMLTATSPGITWGDVPKRSSCPANANGYGPHETTASVNSCAAIVLSDPDGKTLRFYPCKHCGALYGVRAD